jgi:hypothetical protein
MSMELVKRNKSSHPIIPLVPCKHLIRLAGKNNVILQLPKGSPSLTSSTLKQAPSLRHIGGDCANFGEAVVKSALREERIVVPGSRFDSPMKRLHLPLGAHAKAELNPASLRYMSMSSCTSSSPAGLAVS